MKERWKNKTIRKGGSLLVYNPKQQLLHLASHSDETAASFSSLGRKHENQCCVFFAGVSHVQKIKATGNRSNSSALCQKMKNNFQKKASHEKALTSEALTAAAIAGKRDNGSGWSSISPGLVIKIIKRTVSLSVWADRAQDNCCKRKTAGVWSSSALAPSDHGLSYLLRKRVTTCSFASTILTTHHQHESFCSIWLITYAFCCHLSKQKTAAGTDLTEKESSPTAHCCHTAVKSSIRN